MLSFYSQFVRRGDVVFDVGANVGNRTSAFVALGAKVVAVEPQPHCVRRLQETFRASDVIVVSKALGARKGEAEMMVSNIDTLSSLSREWIEKVRKSGRFSVFEWPHRMKVEMTTMDALIAAYGRPSFCKIDVEGYEYEVLQGLSQPIEAVSLEFTPEAIEPALRSIDYLARLGDYRFNYSLLESLVLTLPEWVSAAEVKDRIRGWNGSIRIFGDVYAKLNRK
jgi:FkbM family methyltransferase